MSPFKTNQNPHKLYRNPNKGILFGVCAGIADYFDISRFLVRAITTIGLLISFPLFAVGYIILGFTLDRRPTLLYKSNDEERFWRSVSFAPEETFSKLQYKFRSLNERLKRMEDHVTSSEFDLNQKFKDL